MALAFEGMGKTSPHLSLDSRVRGNDTESAFSG